MPLQGHSLTGITEAQWKSSHNWSAAVDGYRLFVKDKLGQREGGVALNAESSRNTLGSSCDRWSIGCEFMGQY